VSSFRDGELSDLRTACDTLRLGILEMRPNETALTELIDRARQRGGISMEDLQSALPLDTMSAEDVAHVLARLDEAGLDLEIDPDLLLPANRTAPQGTAPSTNRDQTELPEAVPQGRRQQTSLPSSANEPILESPTARRSDSTASAPMLPWVLAFVIVVFAVFAAFAF
jgi:hypothetical protein